MLTKKARRKLAWTILANTVEFKSMITLTYGELYPTNGKQVKRDLYRMLKLLTRYGVGENFWVMEFQVRGAPHVHLAVELDNPDTMDRVALADMWARSIGYDTRHVSGRKYVTEISKLMRVHLHKKSWEPVRKKHGAKFYMVKEAAKPYQKKVPLDFQDVGRFWGCSQGVLDSIQPVEYWDLDESTLRDLLKTYQSFFADSEILPGLLTDFNVKTEI